LKIRKEARVYLLYFSKYGNP